MTVVKRNSPRRHSRLVSLFTVAVLSSYEKAHSLQIIRNRFGSVPLGSKNHLNSA